MLSRLPIFALHIPDGFLSPVIALVCWLLTGVLLGIALLRAKQEIGEQRTPLVGVLAAFIFAAQMINFPVLGGTSGHLVGAALAAIVLGPWTALLVMTSVLAIQAFLFQDGGLLALGANVLNMGIVSAFVGYAVYKLAQRWLGDERGMLLGAALGAWLGVVISASGVAVQLALSGSSDLGVALPAMVGIHVVIGIGEALITTAALAFIRRTRPDLLTTTQNAGRPAYWIAAGLAIALAVTLAAPLASPEPDGLERVAIDQQFDTLAQEAPYQIMPDYTLPMVQQPALSVILSGFIGVIVVALMGAFIGRLLLRR